MDYHALVQRELDAERAAILEGRTYRGPGIYQISRPDWHEVERMDDAEKRAYNGDPSHYDVCEVCAHERGAK